MKHFAIKYTIILCAIVSGMPNVEMQGQETDSSFRKIENLGDYLLYRNHDTTYISNYGGEVAVRILTSYKYNFFRLRDRTNKTLLRYRPIRDISLGVGVSYKWFALDIAIALGLRKNSDFDNTRSFDFQGRFFSSKQFISITIQYYQAYQLSKTSGVEIPVSDPAKRREDLRTINVGLQYLYAINYTKFSMKAPFVFNEIQLKSAGSPIIGAGFNMFVMDADSSVVPTEITDYFVPNANLIDANILSVSLSFGYMYSFVYKKHFFLTLSVIPGINVNAGDYHTDVRHYTSPNVNFKFTSMNAIGYNGRKFYTGFNFITNALFFRLEKKLFVEVGHGKGTFFIGYRFGNK